MIRLRLTFEGIDPTLTGLFEKPPVGRSHSFWPVAAQEPSRRPDGMRTDTALRSRASDGALCDIRIIHATTGEPIRELILNPAVDYQTRGVRKPRPKPS